MSSTRARLLWSATVLFAITAVILFYGHFANDRLIAETAARIDAGRTLAPEARFAEYVRFATTELRDPTLDELPPGFVRWYYRYNPLHPGPADVLRWGSDYRGQCGSHSAVVIAMLRQHGVPARPLLLCNDRGHVVHTVVEAGIGGRWAVADPTFGIVFRRRDGQLATREEIAADPERFHAQVDGVRNYLPEYDYDSVTLMNWNKLPVVFPLVRRGLELTLGPERTERIAKPLLWLRPRASFGLLCLLVAMTSGLLAIRSRRREREDSGSGWLTGGR